VCWSHVRASSGDWNNEEPVLCTVYTYSTPVNKQSFIIILCNLLNDSQIPGTQSTEHRISSYVYLLSKYYSMTAVSCQLEFDYGARCAFECAFDTNLNSIYIYIGI